MNETAQNLRQVFFLFQGNTAAMIATELGNSKLANYLMGRFLTVLFLGTVNPFQTFECFLLMT